MANDTAFIVGVFALFLAVIGLILPTPFSGSYDDLTDIPDLASGLVMWLPLDDTAGDASDYSGCLNHGVISNATSANGKFGKALNFDGVNDYVTVAHSSFINFSSGDFSLSFWGKLTPALSDVLVCKGAYITSGWYIQYYYEGDYGLHMTFNIAGNYTRVYSKVGVVSVGVWCHIVFVKSGFSGIFYINGVNVSKNSTLLFNPLVSTSALTLMRYGAISTYDAIGMLDDMRLYNRSLSLDEIIALRDLP